MLVHALGNAGHPKSLQHIASYMEATKATPSLRRAAVYALRHFTCNKVLLKQQISLNNTLFVVIYQLLYVRLNNVVLLFLERRCSPRSGSEWPRKHSKTGRLWSLLVSSCRADVFKGTRKHNFIVNILQYLS